MKILMVCTNPLLKYENVGAKWVLDGLIELFSSHADVVLLTALSPKDKAFLPNNGNDGGNTYYFRQLTFSWDYLAPFTDFNILFWKKLRKVVKKERVDLLWVTMTYGILSASIVCQGIPIVYDSHHVASDTVGITLARLKKHSGIFGMPIIRRVLKIILQGYISFIERLACRQATHIKAVGEPDRQRFIEKYGMRGDKITVIPPFINPSGFGEAQLKKRLSEKPDTIRVIFHGSYDHSPNHDAFELIINYIAPEVSKRTNNIEFLLAGLYVPVFERGNVKSLGFVEDIQTLLASSGMAIVPMLEGEGVKTKIFDYMVAGLPIISTGKGIQSIKVQDGKHAIICDIVDQKFIEAILDLANDGEKREMLGNNALELAKSEYSQESIQVRFDEMLAKVMQSQECEKDRATGDELTR